MSGILFPHGEKNSFGPFTNPSSNLYGGRDSGLGITDIRIEDGQCKFRLEIDGGPAVGWRLSQRDRLTVGRFSLEAEEGGQEIFCRNDSSSTLLTHRQAQWLARGGQHEEIDGWPLGEHDHELAADVDGDGLDELYIRNHDTAGLLKWQGTAFRAVTVQQGAIGAWPLASSSREFKADLDGDGRDEICIRAPQSIGVVKVTDDQFDLIAIQDGAVDGFTLTEGDREFAGRFTQSARDDILVAKPDGLGLLVWDEQSQQLALRKRYDGSIGSWNFSGSHHYCVGDFDGDGRDEIYVRADSRAGLFKWIGDDLSLEWHSSGPLQVVEGIDCDPVPLTAGDRSYAGRFMPDYDGILHRSDAGLAVLQFDPQGIRVLQCISSPLGDRWNMDAADRFVLGDFHRIGPDAAEPDYDFIIDTLSDVFIHSPGGTAMIGINHGPWDVDQPWAGTHSEIGLTWIQQGYIMSDSSLIASGCLPLARLFQRLFGSD